VLVPKVVADRQQEDRDGTFGTDCRAASRYRSSTSSAPPLSQHLAGRLVTTPLHPGHIVGPGWDPIGPPWNLDPAVRTPRVVLVLDATAGVGCRRRWF